MPRADPHFDKWITNTLVPAEKCRKAQIFELSNYIKKNYEFYPSAEIALCETRIKTYFEEVCDLHDWPIAHNLSQK